MKKYLLAICLSAMWLGADAQVSTAIYPGWEAVQCNNMGWEKIGRKSTETYILWPHTCSPLELRGGNNSADSNQAGCVGDEVAQYGVGGNKEIIFLGCARFGSVAKLK